MQASASEFQLLLQRPFHSTSTKSWSDNFDLSTFSKKETKIKRLLKLLNEIRESTTDTEQIISP